MPLPPGLNKERIAEKKLGQIPTSKRMGIVRAMIDTRGEPDWDFGIPVEKVLKAKLPAGDVMCTCSDGATVLIERKTPDDFLGTLAKNRLFPQVARMVKVTPWSYIVITGLFYKLHTGKTKAGGRETGWDWTAVQGALLTCQEMGASVVYDSNFEGAVQRLCKRDHRVKPIQPARETVLLTEGEQAIAALPGIGHERVQALIKELGSPVRALEWLTDPDDATKVPGVADGTKRKVIKALGLGEEKLAMVARGALPFYLPDEQGSFVATTPGAYGWMCDLWKERENENQKRNG